MGHNSPMPGGRCRFLLDHRHPGRRCRERVDPQWRRQLPKGGGCSSPWGVRLPLVCWVFACQEVRGESTLCQSYPGLFRKTMEVGLVLTERRPKAKSHTPLEEQVPQIMELVSTAMQLYHRSPAWSLGGSAAARVELRGSGVTMRRRSQRPGESAVFVTSKSRTQSTSNRGCHCLALLASSATPGRAVLTLSHWRNRGRGVFASPKHTVWKLTRSHAN